MTSPDSGIHLIMSPQNPNTFEKQESEYIFFNSMEYSESIHLIAWNPFMAMNTNTFYFWLWNTNTFTPWEKSIWAQKVQEYGVIMHINTE